MNMMTSGTLKDLTKDADVAENTALKRLMQQWEKRLAKNTKRAAGFGLMAVTLAACGGSGDGSGDNGDNGDNGTTPITEGGRFFVLDFPTRTLKTQEIAIADGTISIQDAIDAFAQLVSAEIRDGSSVDVVIENLNIIQEAITGADASADANSSGLGGSNADGSASGGSADNLVEIWIDGGQSRMLSFEDFIDLLQANNVITVGRVILTPEFNSGIVAVQGVAPGDQFTEGEFGTRGNPSSGDDTIFIGRTELLHAAWLDGGAGNDTLVVVAKGPYAQPSVVWNIQTIRILNSENTTVNVLDSVDNQNILQPDQIGNLILSTFPQFNSPQGENDTWIDLAAAIDIETLVIGENVGVTDGDLFVVGVNNGAQVVLQGGFENSVLISSGFNFGTSGIFNLRLEDVNFEDGQLIIAQNSTHLAIESTGVDLTAENYIEDGDLGGNLRKVTITGDKFLHINDELSMNTARATTVDASANTGGVKLELVNTDGKNPTDLANNHINFVGSQGDDIVLLTAHSLDISSTGGTNIFDIAGAYALPNQNSTSDPNSFVTGLKLNFDGSDTVDTLIFNQGAPSGLLNYVSEPTVTLLKGSEILGENNTLIAFDPTDFSQATLEGIVSIVMNGTVTVTSDQLSELGAGIFSAYRSAEAPVITQNLHVLVQGDVVLSDLIDTSALESHVKLSFFIPEGASLTLSAQELHELLAIGAIDLGDGDNGTSPGNLIITDAGMNFDPFDSTAVGPDGLPIVGGGTIMGADNNLTIERTPGGWDRPSQAPLDDELVIDSSDGPLEIGPNGFGDPEEFTIPQTDTLIMRGENDITFTAPVSFDGQENFTIDFSAVEGVVSGLEIVDFNNITFSDPGAVPPITPADWGQIIGNGGARIDVQLEGDVGTSDNGLITSGVATYVVTDLNGADREFWTSIPTEDVTTLGLQGNYGNGITFGNVVAGVEFLMEVADDKFNPYTVGELTVVFARDGVADAVVNIVGLQDLPAGEVQTVEGITLGAVNGNGAASATINIEGGNTVIETLTGDFPELTIVADGDVTVEGTMAPGGPGDDLPATLTTIDVSGVEGVFTGSIDGVQWGINIEEAFTFIGAQGGNILTLEDLDGAQTFANTIDGGVGGADLIIQNGVDLCESTLSNITSITLTDTSALTLTPQQIIDLGGLGILNIEDGDTANLTLKVTEDFDIDDLDLASLPEGVALDLSIQSEVELNITGDQLVELFEAGVTISDGSDLADPPGSVNVTDVNQTHLPFPVVAGENDHLTIIPPVLAGTVTLEAGEEVYIGQGYGAFPGAFAWELEGGTLGISVQAMADGLVVNNGDIKLYFIDFTVPTNAADYTNIGMISVPEGAYSTLMPLTFNTESITFLDSATEIEMVPLVPLEFDGTDRVLFVGGTPFAIDDGTGAPYNPETGDAGPVTNGVNLLFNNVSNDANFNVQTVTILFQEGGNIVGDIYIGVGELPDGNAFQTLTLISNGDDVNTIGDIVTVPSFNDNDLLDVTIIANQDFVGGTIFLDAIASGGDGVVTITGTEDVTIKSIDTAFSGNVATLTVDTLGHSGVYTVTGGSSSIDHRGEELIFVGGADSTVLLDTADGPGEDNLGVNGRGQLEVIDASGMAGTLALGDIANVSADGFSLIGGTGVITANMAFDGLPVFDWSFDISDAEAGSAIDFMIDATFTAGFSQITDGNVFFSLTSGSLSLVVDPDTGETTLTFGDDTTLVVEGELDLSGTFDNVVFGDNVEFVLGEEGLVFMDDDDFAAFEAAGGTITGDTAKTFDAGIDLQDARGLTEINIEAGSGGTFTLSSDQVGIARLVDAAGDPISDFGDIQGLINPEDPADSIDLAIVVKDGATFEVTDNEIAGVNIQGDGEVIVTIEGTAGATLNVDTVATDDLPGQSIVVNYVLDGVAGSVTLNNTATNFMSAPLTEAALAGTLDAVAGLNANALGGIVTVSADEPGVEFVITSVDVTGTNGMEIATETFVESTANMSGNLVEDTTHIFPTLGAPAFYTVTGTLGGTRDTDNVYTVQIDGSNFIDLTLASYGPGLVPSFGDGFVLTGGAEIKLLPLQLDELTVTGDGSVQTDMNAVLPDIDLSEIDAPLQVNVTGSPAGFSGETLFNPGQPLALVDTTGLPAPGATFRIFNIDGANIVPNLNRPSEISLDNVNLVMTAAQADGLIVTGASGALVRIDPTLVDSSSNTDLSGIGVPVDVRALDDSDFGGALPSGQPITFSSPPANPHTISLNGNTIPAGAVVTVAANTILDVTGGTLGAGVSFQLAAGTSQLTITGAQADGLSIIGGPNDDGDPLPIGTVNIIDLDGSHDLSGIDGPTLQLTFADDADEGSIAAAAIDGRDITIAGGDPDEDFTLTITGLEDVPDADLSGLTLALDNGANDTNVVIEVTGDVTIGEDADFGMTGADSITLSVLGGVVDVEDGADLSGIGAFDVAAGATLVADQSLTDPLSAINPANVSGEGTLEITGFEAGDTLSGSDGGATQNIDFVTFTFDGDEDYANDGEVTINNFLVGGASGRDQIDLNDIHDVQSVSTSANKANLEGANDGAVLILTSTIGGNATSALGMQNEFGGDQFGDLGATNILVTVDGPNDAWYVWLWEDGVNAEGSGVNVDADGEVGLSELTLISVIDSTDSLTAANFIV